MWIILSTLAFAQSAPTEGVAAAEAVSAVSAPPPEAAMATPERSAVPAVTPAPLLQLPEFVEFELKPGVKGVLLPVSGVRKAGVTVLLHQGQLALDGEATAASHLTGWLMDAATTQTDLSAMSVYEDSWEVSVSSWIEPHQTVVQLTAPRETLERGTALLAEVLKTPSYPKSELKRQIRENKRDLLETGPADPSSLVGSITAYAWHGPDTPWGRRPDLKEWKSVRTKDLLARHARILANAPVTVIFAGDLDEAAARAAVAPFLDALGAAGTASAPPPFTPPSASRVVAVDQPGLGQVQLRVRFAAPPKGHADEGAFSLVNYALGGAFLSRMNTSLREEKGLTYGAYSRYVAEATRGTWTLSFDTAVDQTALAVSTVEAEITRMAAGGLTQEELAAARTQFAATWNSTLQTSSSTQGAAEYWVQNGLSPQRAREKLVAQSTLDVAATQAAATTWMSASAPRLWVLVGDRQVIEPQLQQLGLTAEWVSAQDAMLGLLP